MLRYPICCWLGLLSLSACVAMPNPMATVVAESQFEIQRASKPSPSVKSDTAKILMPLAQDLANRWANGAEVVHIEGRMIAANGFNEAVGAVWEYSFISARKKNKGLLITLKGPQNPPQTRELPLAQLKAHVPLPERAWGIDSNRAVFLGQKQHAITTLPVPQMTLITQDERLVWKLPGQLTLDAMNGTVIAR